MIAAEPAALAADDRVAALAVADELVALTRALADLAFDLADDPEVARRHIEALQAIDLVTQVHVALAELLRSTAPLGRRIDAVTVQALADRLRRAAASLSAS